MDGLKFLNQYDQLLKKLKMEPSLVICGGEPLISPYLFPILNKMNNMWKSPPLTILTNGTKINENLLERLSEFNIEFQISIDGPDADSHDAIRGRGNFKKALNGAKLAKKYGFKTNILAILSKNSSIRVTDFFKMAKDNSLDSMNFTRLIPQGAGAKLVESGEDGSLYGQELKAAFTNILLASKKYGVKTATNSPLYNLIDPTLGRNGGFGFQGLVVDYKGQLKVSSRADYILGDVAKEGLENLFLHHPIMKDLRDRKIKGCGDCMYYSRCGGDRNISYATTGSFLEKDKGCWIEPVQKTEEKIA